MPKVSSEYFEQKRKSIIDATLRACEKKTVSSLTMQDIINESGLSQGGIYKFYPNIDMILADVLEELHLKLSLDETADSYNPTLYSPIENVHNVWKILCEHIKNNLVLNKIHFEFYILLSNFPTRAVVIWENVKIPDPYEKMNQKTAQYIHSLMETGAITPRIPIPDYFQYCAAIFDGIVKRMFTETGYVNSVLKNTDFVYNLDSMFQIAAMNSSFLLGIN